MSAIEVSSWLISVRLVLTSCAVMAGQLSWRTDSFLWASRVAECREEVTKDATSCLIWWACGQEEEEEEEEEVVVVVENNQLTLSLVQSVKLCRPTLSRGSSDLRIMRPQLIKI